MVERDQNDQQSEPGIHMWGYGFRVCAKWAHPGMTAVGRPGHGRARANYAAAKAGTGKAVTDFIFSMAKRDVTFFSATAPISFL
jgi:hypothetical protein